LAHLAAEERTMVLFSATKRVVRDLSDLAAALGERRDVMVARELTKVFEEVWRGTLGEAAAHWEITPPRGEFTLVVGGAPPVPVDLAAALVAVDEAVASGLPLAEAVRRVAADVGARRRDLYQAALARRVAPEPSDPT
jgi:16S rRNA (cytidine1402-2'-O)-methyltransferase